MSIEQKQEEVRKTVEAVFKAYRLIREAMKDHLEVIDDIRASFEYLAEVFQQIKDPLKELQLPYDLPAYKKILEAKQKVTSVSKSIDQAFKGIEDIEGFQSKAENDLMNYVNTLKEELDKEKRKNKWLQKRVQQHREKALQKQPKYIA